MNTELSKFVQACAIKGECEEMGDSKNGNKQHKIIHSVYLVLKEGGRLEELLELLDHENPYVRSWAAGYTLQISPLRAEETLEKLTDIRSRPVGFNAAMTLQEWKKGNLKL